MMKKSSVGSKFIEKYSKSPGTVECPLNVFWQILKVRLKHSLFSVFKCLGLGHKVGSLRQQFCQDDLMELLGMVTGVDKDTE